MKTYKFDRLPKRVQVKIIEGKINDIIRQGLVLSLAYDIVYNDNILLEQCQNELYDIDGNFMKEVK